MTIANAVEEMRREGERNDTSHWRTLKADGSLNEKYPGGAKVQRRLLEEEGHTIIQRGKEYAVQDCQKSRHQW